jgi:uncharacterized protein (TIGR02996 family)
LEQFTSKCRGRTACPGVFASTRRRAEYVAVQPDHEAAGLAAIFQRITQAPRDDEPRRAYADAVEDSDPERAELIRIQLERARRRAERWQPERDMADGGGVMIRREQGMLNRRGAEWAADISPLVTGWHFERGFVGNVGIDAARFLATAPEIYRRAPVLDLNLRGVRPVARELFASPHLSRIRSMWLVRADLGDAEAIALAESPYLGALEWLDLGANRIGAAGLDALAASERLPRLAYVGFMGNAIPDPTPRFADEYDADTREAAELQRRHGRREWLSAHPRPLWPPDRDAAWPLPR